MTNAELIEELRCCASLDTPCKGLCPYHGVEYCLSKKDLDAADALEAAYEMIADYTAAIDALDDSNDAYIKENERLKKRIAELESQMPKEGEWRWNSLLNEYEWVDNTIYCPNCGAKMRKGDK